MEERYDPRSIEAHWQQVWEERRLFEAGHRGSDPKYYVLEMFPYPSGAMHMGHARVYGIGDVLARFERMRGRDVLHPMGYDALGLPAENAAIRDGVHPAKRTAQNIVSFEAEMKAMGFSFDWSRKFATSDPAYYRWNQWFFLKMLERDLVYRRQGWVNWCPLCQTVLANEQVEDGVCWRGHPGVTHKRIGEWAFRITRYADALLEGLNDLTGWPERIVSMQRNWIGRSEGAEITFPVEGSPTTVTVFTTRLDTIYGCTYLVLAPEHPLAQEIASPAQRPAVAAFAERMLKTDRLARTAVGSPKEGVDTGARAVNPFTGEHIPIWTANFVLGDYGTGAVMSVPAHDARDFAFAQQYGLPIRVVIQPASGEKLTSDGLAEAFTSEGTVAVGGAASGLPSDQARRVLVAQAEDQEFGEASVHYQLRDWGFSRQRYWGTPIPVVYCTAEGTPEAPRIVPVPYDQLPVLLPERAVLTGEGEPPLAKVPEFIEVACPSCGKPARREAETMDTFVDSSWYFARFLSPGDEKLPFERADADRYLPMDTYIGGPEHAVLHLLYFRFWTRVMADLGLCSVREPAQRLITQGIVLGPDGEKMSKSRGNVISPRPYLDRFGADVTRLFVLFAAPVERDFAWNDSQVEGMQRFLGRVWRLAYRFQRMGMEEKAAARLDTGALRRLNHHSLKRVTDDLERVHFNTAIAALMELLNGLTAALGPEGSDQPLPPPESAALREGLEVLTVGLSPFAPHFAEELWRELGHAQTLQESRWPDFDPALVVAQTQVYAIQVNGKLRGQIEVPVEIEREEIERRARTEEKVAAQLQGKELRKTVFVPKRLVNFVVG